jgi:hypothetical protein
MHISKSFVGFNNPESNCIKFLWSYKHNQYHPTPSCEDVSSTERLTKYFCQEWYNNLPLVANGSISNPDGNCPKHERI